MAEPIKILLVDDDELDRMQVRRLVARCQEELVLVEVATLREARYAFFAQSFSCVLLDVNLPDGQGLELLRELPGVPAVMLTGVDDDQMPRLALKQGAQDYLVKGSFDEQMLLRSVMYAMQRSQRQAQDHAVERLAHQVSLGRLAASVAHQINNPNTFIQGNLSLLYSSLSRWDGFMQRLRQQARFNPELGRLLGEFPELSGQVGVPEMLRDAQQGTARVTGVVQQLQTLRSMEVDQRHQRVNLKHCLTDALELMRGRPEALQVKETLLEEELWVMGHAGRLQNLLSFLLFNAQERAQGSQNKVLLELSRDKGRAICTLRHQGRFEPLQMSAALSLNQLDLRMVICDTIALEHAGQLSFEEGDDQVIRLELPHIA